MKRKIVIGSMLSLVTLVAGVLFAVKDTEPEVTVHFQGFETNGAARFYLTNHSDRDISVGGPVALNMEEDAEWMFHPKSDPNTARLIKGHATITGRVPAEVLSRSFKLMIGYDRRKGTLYRVRSMLSRIPAGLFYSPNAAISVHTGVITNHFVRTTNAPAPPVNT
jgi:hypothetical protein